MAKELGISVARALGLWLLAAFTIRLLSLMPWTEPRSSHRTFADWPEGNVIIIVSAGVPLVVIAMLGIWLLRSGGKFIPPSANAIALDRPAACSFLRVMLLGAGILSSVHVAACLIGAYGSIVWSVAMGRLGPLIWRHLDLVAELLWAGVFLRVGLSKKDALAQTLIGSQP